MVGIVLWILKHSLEFFQAKEEVSELQKKLSSYERDKLSLQVCIMFMLVYWVLDNYVLYQNSKAKLKVQESQLKSLRWEHEVLEQRFSQVRTWKLSSIALINTNY